MEERKEKGVANLQESMEGAVARAMASVENGVGIAPFIGMDEDQCEAVYALGHRRYARQDYQGAEEIFAWLCGIAGVNGRFLKALAAARKMQGKHEEALNAYALAAFADFSDPEPSFHAAECLFRMGEMKRTRHALLAAREQAEALGDHEAMIARIDEMLPLVPESAAEREEGDAPHV